VGVAGEVVAQFVVDTLGRVDSASIKVTRSSAPDLEAAVRSVLPRYRFEPARTVGGCKVAQLVVIPFRFQ
jgi:TonB family protein